MFRIRFLLFLVCSLTLCVKANPTAFSYQGRLMDSGGPANGTYDLQFKLYAVASGGTAIGTPVTLPAVPVSEGMFTVSLDFGAGIFDGNDRWLEIGVRTNGSAAAFTLLNPRQPVTPAPVSMHATTADTATTATSASTVTGPISDTQLSTNVVRFNGSQQLIVQKIGVNTNNPQSALHVNGTLLATTLKSVESGFESRAGFTGINRTTPVTGSDVFSVRAPFTNSFGGMYIETAGSGLPFYGYAMSGTARAWHYVDGSDSNKWKLNVSGDRLAVTTDGKVGINKTAPATTLDVNGTVTATAFSGNGAALTSLNAANVTSGLLPLSRGGTGRDLSVTGPGMLLMCDSNGVPTWQSPSALSVFFGQNYTALMPDTIDNTVLLEVQGVMEANVVMVNGPGFEIQRITGFAGTNSNDQPGPNMELPVVFEYGGSETNALQGWYNEGVAIPDMRRVVVIIIKNLDGTEAGRWDLYEMKLTQIANGNNGRKRYTMSYGLAPDNTVGYVKGISSLGQYSINPVTDPYLVEIEGVSDAYPATQINFTNRTLTFTYDRVEGANIYGWAQNTARGLGWKRVLNLITQTNGVEASRMTFYGVFPISYQQTTGFAQPEKLKEKVVVSFDHWN